MTRPSPLEVARIVGDRIRRLRLDRGLRIADALEVDEWRLFARDEVAEEVSAAEMVLLRCLRETGMAPEQALARLVSP